MAVGPLIETVRFTFQSVGFYRKCRTEANGIGNQIVLFETFENETCHGMETKLACCVLFHKVLFKRYFEILNEALVRVI